MIEKDKSLIENKENIFKKIIKSIKKLFEKENLSELPINDAKEDLENIDFSKYENENLHTNESIKPTINPKAEEKYKEIKDRFFEKYNQYKKGEVSSKELSSKELFMANKMLEEELEMNKTSSINETRKLNELNEKISNLEKRVNANS